MVEHRTRRRAWPDTAGLLQVVGLLDQFRDRGLLPVLADALPAFRITPSRSPLLSAARDLSTRRRESGTTEEVAMRYDDKFQLRDPDEVAREQKDHVHVFGKGVVCNTDSRGFPTPQDRDPLDIVVDATEGFIPLWARDVTLRWRFQYGQQKRLSCGNSESAAWRGAVRRTSLSSRPVWRNAVLHICSTRAGQCCRRMES
jgi:hypothetical protein